MQKNKIQEIHYLRAFGALGVVLLHSLAVGSQHNLFIDSLRQCLGYVIPIFIFISGFVLTYSHKENYGIINFYKKRFGAILFPYLIFSALYYFYALHHNYIPEHRINIPTFLADVALGKTYFHLWFFVILFQLYLLFPFLIKFYKKIQNKVVIFLIFTFILQVIWNILSDIKPSAELGTIFPSLLFYFVLGMYVSSKYDKTSAILNKINVFIPIALFVAANTLAINFEYLKFLFLPISFVISFWMFFKISSLIRDKNNLFIGFLNITASFSLGIYLIHVFYIDFSGFILNKSGLPVNNDIIGVVLYAGALSFSVLSCLLISKTPFGNYLIGAKR